MNDTERDARVTTWFRAYGDRVLAYLLHRADPDTAHDVLQEVFVIAFRKAHVVPDPPIGWLFGTARRVLANTRRAARRRDQLTARLAEQPLLTTDASPQIPVAEALAGMSPADREVLTLSAWYELSADDAAQALGCSRGAYTVRLHRARRRLAETLRADGYPARPLVLVPADQSANATGSARTSTSPRGATDE